MKTSKSKRLLIVEDDPMMVEVLKHELTTANYEVENTNMGEKALNLVDHQKFDAIIMDINLDGELDGIETAKKICKHYPIPIVYLSDIKDSLIYKHAVHGYYLAKPVNFHNLLITVKRAIEKHQLLEWEFDAFQFKKKCIYIGEAEDIRGTLTKINIEDIYWIETYSIKNEKDKRRDQHFFLIVTKDKSYRIKRGNDSLEKKFKHPLLLRTSKYYLVNGDKIKQFTSNFQNIIIEDLEEIKQHYEEKYPHQYQAALKGIPLSKLYREGVAKQFTAIR